MTVSFSSGEKKKKILVASGPKSSETTTAERNNNILWRRNLSGGDPVTGQGEDIKMQSSSGSSFVVRVQYYAEFPSGIFRLHRRARFADITQRVITLWYYRRGTNSSDITGNTQYYYYWNVTWRDSVCSRGRYLFAIF